MKKLKRSCGICLFFLEKTDSTGKCRRDPPRACVCGSAVLTCFPEVQSDEWCGSFSLMDDSE